MAGRSSSGEAARIEAALEHPLSGCHWSLSPDGDGEWLLRVAGRRRTLAIPAVATVGYRAVEVAGMGFWDVPAGGIAVLRVVPRFRPELVGGDAGEGKEDD